MAQLRYATKFDAFLSLDCTPALHPGAIQGKEGIKFCHLATLIITTIFALGRLQTLEERALVQRLGTVKWTLFSVARWQNVIPSFPWVAPGWRAGVQSKERKGLNFAV